MNQQLPLFTLDDPEMPDPLTLLRNGAALVLSVSAGKDSDSMAHFLLDKREREGWTGEVLMLHADLGLRVEWAQTPAYVRDLAQRKGVPLYVVSTQNDLIDRIWQRYHKDPTRPPWPSSKIRYCTSDLKRAPSSRFFRNHFPASQNVINAMGIRSQESKFRAGKAPFALRKDSSAPTKGRFVYDWLPIHDWTTEQVWKTIREHGDIAHPAYRIPETPNERLSCALCIMASINDLINGAVHNPDIYREYCHIEAVTGYSFRQGLWLSDLNPELLPESTLTTVQLHKQRKSS